MQRKWLWFGAAAMLLLAAALIQAGVGRGSLPRPTPLPTIAVSVMPSTPTDGVLTLVIPAGAAADQQAGGRGYEMPSVISLRVGDTIVIRNEDDAPHMILYAWVEPGDTYQRTFTQPGSEVYSSGCGVHAASFLSFTTIFIGE